MANGFQQYDKLENHLLLLSWLNGLLGYEHNRDLLADIKQADEGFEASGYGHIYHHLLPHGRPDQTGLLDGHRSQ